jgi:hypothetical protein
MSACSRAAKPRDARAQMPFINGELPKVAELAMRIFVGRRLTRLDYGL